MSSMLLHKVGHWPGGSLFEGITACASCHATCRSKLCVGLTDELGDSSVIVRRHDDRDETEEVGGR